MKRALFTLTLAGALAGALASCADEDMAQGGLQTVTITASMADPSAAPSARTCVDVSGQEEGVVGLFWLEGDSIGVFGTSGTRNALFRNPAAGATGHASFTGQLAAGELPQYAYYPQSPLNDGRSPQALSGTLPAQQPFDPTTGRITGDYKIGAPVTTHRFVFRHLFSMLRVTVDATGTSLAGDRLERIELSVKTPDGADRAVGGTFTFSAVDGTWGNLTDEVSTIAMPWTTRPELTAGASYQGFITILPTVRQGDLITISVVTAGHRATFTAPCLVDFEAETIYNIPLTLSTYAERADEFGYQEVELPALRSFAFSVAANEGKILSRQLVWNASSNEPAFQSVSEQAATIDGDSVRLMVPYLYDFHLVPTFTTSEGCTVSVGGEVQTSGATAQDFSQPVTYTVTAADGTTRDYVVDVTNTGLPVVVINQSASGDFSPVYKDTWAQITKDARNEFVDFMVRGKDTEWVEDDQLTVYTPDGTVDVSAACGVRLRGNTTQDYPKKPLAVKFAKKQAVLGLPKHKRWVLLANWLDHSMIRNAVAFDVAHALEQGWRQEAIEPGIPWNVHGQNVELVIDGRHVGNYYLCEQIKIDENRLAIQEAYEDVASPTFETCGYLMELDTNYDETYKFITPRYSVPFMLKDDLPDAAIFQKVQAKVLGIEENIYQGDFAAAYADLDLYSVIDQWLIWELTMNREYVDPRSVYYFMDGAGKLSAGPVWDFDRGTFQNTTNAAAQGNTDRVKPYDEWICWTANPKAGLSASTLDNGSSCVWYPELIQDPTFQQAVQARWAVLYPYLQGVVANIQAYGRTMAASYEVNNAMWPTTKAAIHEHKSGFTDWSGDENIEAYADVIANFVSVYQQRLEGMNQLITTGRFTK